MAMQQPHGRATRIKLLHLTLIDHVRAAMSISPRHATSVWHGN